MIRRPPRSTPFPTRRSSDLPRRPARVRARAASGRRGARLGFDLRDARSEEHTSELQSQSNLVCRLLLEKKTPTDAAATSASAISLPLLLRLLRWARS